MRRVGVEGGKEKNELSLSLSLFPLISSPSLKILTSLPIRNAVFPWKTPGADTLTAPSSISTPSSLAPFSARSHSFACESLGKWRKKTWAAEPCEPKAWYWFLPTRMTWIWWVRERENEREREKKRVRRKKENEEVVEVEESERASSVA